LPKLFTTKSTDDATYNNGVFPIAPTLEEFKHRFEIYTHSILDGINWDNVFCAGGSILGNLW
jgi:hypothetical protein